MKYLKYIPAGLCFTFAGMFWLASTGGDNSDARALAQIMLLPAAGCFVMGVLVAAITYFWSRRKS